MESSASQISGHHEAGSSGTTIEIKIKTMDSQTYTLQVDKQVPVPALKEQIASVTGVVTEHQRLICRGKVLKDNQLLSAYHVEDGHTLHLVVRQPAPTSTDDMPTDPGLSTSTGNQSQFYQVAPGVLVETLNMSSQGDRSPSDIGRIVSAVLGSIGITSPTNLAEGATARDHVSERTTTRGDATEAAQQQSEQPGMRSGDRSRSHRAFGVSTAFSFGSLQAPVIPDALSTLSQYLSHMRHEFIANDVAGDSASEHTEFISALHLVDSQAGLPTPASLVELLNATRQILNQQIGESLVQLARQLENQAAVTDPDVRSSTQSNAMRTGILLQNLGAYLLELGRTVTTLRLGRSPSEAVVNAGPAVFISSSGPNPIMVQPLPFQPGSSFNSSQVWTIPPPGTGLGHGFASGSLPRHIDIQIRRGSIAHQSDLDGSQQQNSAPRDSSAGFIGETAANQPTMTTSDPLPFGGSGGRSVRVLPLRSMVSAIPDPNRVSSDSPGNLSGLYYPLPGRYQNVASRNVTGGRLGSLVIGGHQPIGQQAEQNPTLEHGSQPQRTEYPSENGQRSSPHSHSVDISIYSSGGAQNNQNSGERVPDGVMQFLRNLFPGGRFHMESVSPEGAANPMESYTEHMNTSSAVNAEGAVEPRATEEGIFFSRMLQQIMPYISNLSGLGQNASSSSGGNSSSAQLQAENFESGSIRRRSNNKLHEPNAKRHKME